MVEVAGQISNNNEFEWLGLLNHTGRLGYANHEPVTSSDIRIRFLPEKPVKAVKSLIHDLIVPVIQSSDGWYEVVLSNLGGYDVLLVEY